MRLPHQLPVDPAALSPKRIKVGKAPARIVQPGPAAEMVLVVNRGTYTVYVGDASVVDVSNGLPVPPLGSVALSTSIERYAVVDVAAGNNTSDLWVLPAGVSYTPAPSEIAAQIASQHLDVSGSTVDATGSAIDIANQPTVTAAGANANGTPSTAADFASRQVSADSSAFASVGASASATLIAAPGVGNSIELHAGVVNVTSTALSVSGATTRTEIAQITRSDNGAVIAEVRCAAASTAANVSAGNQTSVAYDFQGATLPPNVGLNLVTTTSTGSGAGSASVTLAYATVH